MFSQDSRQRMDILGVRVDAVNLDLAARRIGRWIQQRRRRAYVCVAPVATIMDCQKDPDYRRVVNQADMVTPDGMPVVWIARTLKRNPQVQRTYGPDLMRKLCDEGRARGFRHYFYGGTPEVLKALTEALRRDYPGIHICGCLAPGFRAVGEKEGPSVLAGINAARPDIVWVGLGSPKQDYWMANHRADVAAPVMIGVGAAFDFVAGVKPQAPRWMRHSGLEWLFRLASEPARLWRRYVIGNTLFLVLLTRDIITGKIFRTP